MSADDSNDALELVTNDAPALVVKHSDGELSMGYVGCVLIGIWRKDMRTENVATLTRTLDALRAALPGQKLGVLNLIETGCSIDISPQGTSALTEMLKRHAGVLVGSAVVYARDGFWNASLRSRATAIHGDSQMRVPYYVAASLFDAANWLVEQLGDGTTVHAASIVQALTQLRFER